MLPGLIAILDSACAAHDHSEQLIVPDDEVALRIMSFAGTQHQVVMAVEFSTTGTYSGNVLVEYGIRRDSFTTIELGDDHYMDEIVAIIPQPASYLLLSQWHKEGPGEVLLKEVTRHALPRARSPRIQLVEGWRSSRRVGGVRVQRRRDPLIIDVQRVGKVVRLPRDD